MGARSKLASGCALLAVGCSSNFRTTAETLTHSANVLPPGGPSIGGTPLRPRTIAVEVSGAYSVNNTGDAPRRSGGLAHRNADLQGSARLLLRAGPLEIGPSVDWSFGPSTPASPDDDVPPGDLSFRAGLATRLHLVQRPRWTVGLNLEALFMHVVVRSTRNATSGASAFGSCDDPSAIAYYGSAARCLGAWGHGGSAPGDEGTTRESAQERFELRAGLFGGGAVARNVWLLGGVLGQIHPRIRGFESVTLVEHCSGGGIFLTCGPEQEASGASGTTFVGTLWFGVGVDLGALSLYAQVHTNALGPSEITARVPVGFSLNTRFNFGL